MKKIRNSTVPVFKIPKAQYGLNPGNPIEALTPSYYKNMFNDPNFGQTGDRQQVQLAQNQQQPLPPTVQPLPTMGVPPSLQDRFDEQISGMEIPTPDTAIDPPPDKTPEQIQADDNLMTASSLVGGLAQQSALSSERPQAGLAGIGGALQGLSVGAKFGPWGAGIGAAAGGVMALAGAAGARSNYEDAKYNEIDNTIRRNEYTGEDLGRLPGQFQMGGEVSLSSFVNDSARNMISNYEDVDEDDLNTYLHYAGQATNLDEIKNLEKEYMTPKGRKSYKAKYGMVVKK